MLKKIFGKGRKDDTTRGGERSQAQLDPMIDEDETIVIDLSGYENPHPDDVRVEIDEPQSAPPRPESPVPALAPASGPDPAGSDGEDTVIWTGQSQSNVAASAADPVMATEEKRASTTVQSSRLTAGWLVVKEGDCRGRSFTVRVGRNKVGRGNSNAIILDMGDDAISQNNHVTLAADPKTNRYFAIPGESTNFTYLDGEPLLEAQEIRDKSTLQIGETVFVFIQFMGQYVDWD